MTILAARAAIGADLSADVTIQLPVLGQPCDIPWCTRHYPDESEPTTLFHCGGDKDVQVISQDLFEDGEIVTHRNEVGVHICEVDTLVGGETFRGFTVLYVDDLGDVALSPESALALAEVIASRARLAIAARDGVR